MRHMRSKPASPGLLFKVVFIIPSVTEVNICLGEILDSFRCQVGQNLARASLFIYFTKKNCVHNQNLKRDSFSNILSDDFVFILNILTCEQKFCSK